MSKKIYPLKFNPIFKEKIWGGHKIATLLHKDFSPLANCGESWELSGVEDEVSVVANGFLSGNELNELIEIYMYDLVGDEPYLKYGLGFPLLIKFIDAEENLSVQVHPDDKLAGERYGLNGKTELWHVLNANPGAGLYVGFQSGTTRQRYLDALKNGTIEQLLQFYPVAKGDTFFIPAGTVHAIGKGVLLAEIQQPSDITYRIFDWNRVDEHGQSRDLHIEEALNAISFDDKCTYKIEYEKSLNSTSKIIRSDFFNINLLSFDKPIQKSYHNIDSFVIYICVEGEIHFLCDDTVEILKKGEVLLKPALLETLNLVPVVPSQALEVWI